MKKYLILIFLLGWLGSFAQVSGSLQTQAQDYAFNSVSQYVDIQVVTPPVKVTVTALDSVAAPKLPVFIQNFVLPAGNQVTGLQVIQILNIK